MNGALFSTKDSFCHLKRLALGQLIQAFYWGTENKNLPRQRGSVGTLNQAGKSGGGGEGTHFTSKASLNYIVAHCVKCDFVSFQLQVMSETSFRFFGGFERARAACF